MENTLFLNNITINFGSCGFYDYSPAYKGVKGKKVNDYQFFFIREGNAEIKIDKNIYSAQKGHLFIFQPDFPVDIVPNGISSFKLSSFHFEARLLHDINLFSVYPIPFKLEPDNTAEFENNMNHLIQICTAKEDFYTLKALPILSPMILTAIEEGKSLKIFNKTQFSEEQKRIKKVLNYIQDKYTLNITIHELASLISVSPNYFIHFFKKRTGVSPAVFIQNYKIEKAKQMIINGLLLSRIAETLNFSDAFHFSKTFKKVTGMSPREYKHGMISE